MFKLLQCTPVIASIVRKGDLRAYFSFYVYISASIKVVFRIETITHPQRGIASKASIGVMTDVGEKNDHHRSDVYFV